MPREARIMPYHQNTWTNKHQNFTQQIEMYYDIANPRRPVTDAWSDMRLTVAKLQSLIAQAAQDNARLRAYGGTWSLSRAAVTNGRLIDTRYLNWRFPLKPQHVSPDYPRAAGNLIFAQCGISISELNKFLAGRKSSLKTSGASNGQTFAGAVSTGTHGSAIEIGSMQDYVVGLHIIVAPDKHVWLERKSYPVASGDLISKLGVAADSVLRDDMLFNAALVSFGSFGIIHGLVFEVEALYLLEASRQRMAIDNHLRQAMETLDFSALQLPDPNEPPFHFEVVINPHDIQGGAYVTTMYQRKYRNDYIRPPQLEGGFGPGDDLLAVIGNVNDAVPDLVPAAVNFFVNRVNKVYQKQEGVHGEIFSATDTHGKATSTEIGVAKEDASRVLDCLLDVHRVAGPFGGVFAFRFVKKSDALLAFTKFPYTCTIELPGVFSNRSDQFFQRVWAELDNAGIDYTLHWGQVNNFTPARVRKMYGDAAVNQWIQSRNTLLNAQMRKVFSSPFLESCGLG